MKIMAVSLLTVTAAFSLSVAVAPNWLSLLRIGLDPDRAALKAALTKPELAEIDAVYRSRNYKPLWFTHGAPSSDAYEVLRYLSDSTADGLDPALYRPQLIFERLRSAAVSTPSQKAAIELMTTRAYISYVGDLHTPVAAAGVLYTDPSLRPPGRPSDRQILTSLIDAKTLQAGIRSETGLNMLYGLFRAAIKRDQSRLSEQARVLLLTNLERARALPVDLGERFLLVDVASAQLWMVEGNKAVGRMDVVVGKPTEPTPSMAGVVRYALFNPYWNVPPDLVRKVYAPRIRAHRDVLQSLHMEPWTGYAASDHRLDGAQVDWSAVQSGAQPIGLRQRPGANNAMGAVKFMFPNELGIYLHDSPDKALFARSPRDLSAGCVRVANYKELAHWLFNGEVSAQGDRADQRVNLERPIPVYITYFTALPRGVGMATEADVYGRDPAIIRQLRVGKTTAQGNPGKASERADARVSPSKSSAG